MAYVPKAQSKFPGVDGEVKNDASSVYSTKTNTSFYPVLAAVAAPAAPQTKDMRLLLLHLLNERTQKE
jgi:hypothetical protein